MFKNPNRSGRKKTHEKGTKFYAVHILNILEKYSGIKSTGEIIYLKVSGDSLDKNGNYSIQHYLSSMSYYEGQKIDRNTITGILGDLCGLEESDLPQVRCVEDSSGSRILGYYIDAPKLNAGEYAFLSSLIQYAPFLQKSTKEAIQKKILTITDETYSKTIGQAQASAQSDILKPIYAVSNVEMIHKAITSKLKISFSINEYRFDKQLHQVETDKDVVFSPYEIVSTNNFLFVVGKREGEGELSHYRIDKLSHIKPSVEYFERDIYNLDTQKYINEHPFMNRTDKNPCRAYILIKEEDLDKVIDAFGLDIQIRKYGEKYGKRGFLQVCVAATENDILHWSLMNADISTVLHNDSEATDRIRRDLRRIAETTAEKYLYSGEDIYWAMVDESKMLKSTKFKRDEKTFCTGLDLSRRTEFHKLKNIASFVLNRENNISNISFISNYKKLKVFRNNQAFVEDYSPLCEIETLEEIWIAGTEIKSLDFLKRLKHLKRLHLNSNTILDFSALYTILNIDYIVLGKKEHEYIDIKKVKVANPNSVVRGLLTFKIDD